MFKLTVVAVTSHDLQGTQPSRLHFMNFIERHPRRHAALNRPQ
jgi:hypothetical protein